MILATSTSEAGRQLLEDLFLCQKQAVSRFHKRVLSANVSLFMLLSLSSLSLGGDEAYSDGTHRGGSESQRSRSG